ncbi:MAG: hypothetical protein ACYDIA_26245 [Candidatus Humimicrobiaceae bacterium]
MEERELILNGSLRKLLFKFSLPATIGLIARQVVFLIPGIIILPLFFKLNGVWFSLPLSDFLSTVLTSFFVLYELKLIKKLQLKENT